MVSGITHTGASFSASITINSVRTVTYSLYFHVREVGGAGSFFPGGTPSNIWVNGNKNVVFTGSTNALTCGKTYEVGSVYQTSDGNAFFTGTGYTRFNTIACATLTPPALSLKLFTGSAISPVTLTAANFNGATTFRVSPALPAGLSLNATSGVITGTPSATTIDTRYVITGTGAVSGTATVALTLRIVPGLSDTDVLSYVASYPDLIGAFGTNVAQARQHYLDYGFVEGRTISFEPYSYIASHADLRSAFGADPEKGATHYIQYGYRENRTTTFNALRYIASHPDLITAFSTDRGKGAKHYIEYGLREGRGVTFDALRYVASNPDLVSSHGKDETKAITHYIQFGFREGRSPTSFDPLAYIASYGDLIKAFGFDVAAAVTHFIEYGYREGRAVLFDALAYIASFGDLIKAFGIDATAGVRHFILYGFNEGRKAVFDALGYLAAHADLRTAFGTDTTAATKHFITYGFNEGRTYLWTVSATAGAGGKVSAARTYVKTGERVSISVTPQSGYQIVSVTGCGGSLSGSIYATSTYTTGPVTGTCSVSASFKLAYIDGALSPDCVGAQCAAINATTYAGSGIGVWTYKNSSTPLPALLNIAFTGVKGGNTVTLLFSNGGKTSAPTQPNAGSIPSASPSPAMHSYAAGPDMASNNTLDPQDLAHLKILESNRRSIASLRYSPSYVAGNELENMISKVERVAEAPALGAQRTWKDAAFNSTVDFATSVRATCTAASGRAIVFWVDDQTWVSGKINSTLIDKFKGAYCGNSGGYERLVKLYGEPWGTHPFDNLISDSPTLQDLNVVIVPSKEGYAGYFWSLNAFKENEKSNKALVFFINASQFSGDSTSSSTTNFYIGTLIHEMMHMVNYYQRGIRLRSYHDTWLEETSAMMSEDIITPTVTEGYNKIATVRLPNYLRVGGNVSYINWSELSGDLYAIGGAFGAFMNRRYGLNLFKALQTCPSDSYACIDSFANRNGGGSFANEFARMGASMFSLLPASNLPEQYGFPARTDGEYTLSAIDISARSSIRPNTGAGLSSGYRATSQTFIEDTVAAGKSSYVRNEVLVPAGTSLTVIVK